MHKYFFTVVVVVLLSAPSCWAQRFIKPVPKRTRVLAAQQAGLKTTSRQLSRIAHSPVKWVPLDLLVNSPETVAARIERQIAFKQLHDNLLAKAQEAKVAEQKTLAANTPLGLDNVTSQTAPILFRNIEIGVLNPQEHVLTAAAYDSNGFQVSFLQYTSPDGKEIPISQLEAGLPGYGIQRVIVVLRRHKTETTPQQLRLIDYDLATGTITTSAR